MFSLISMICMIILMFVYQQFIYKESLTKQLENLEKYDGLNFKYEEFSNAGKKLILKKYSGKKALEKLKKVQKTVRRNFSLKRYYALMKEYALFIIKYIIFT